MHGRTLVHCRPFLLVLYLPLWGWQVSVARMREQCGSDVGVEEYAEARAYSILFEYTLSKCSMTFDLSRSVRKYCNSRRILQKLSDSTIWQL